MRFHPFALLLLILTTAPFAACAPGASSPAAPTPTMAYGPTAAAHNPGVANLLRNPPAPGVSVEVDAYTGGVGVRAYRVGPPLPPELAKCPIFERDALTDKRFPTRLVTLTMDAPNTLPDDEPWLLAAGWHPFHGRLRGHLGDPTYAQCPQANRIFVIEQVVKIYQMDRPEVLTPVSPSQNQRLPADYASWPVYHDPALGFSVPHPPDWRVEQTGPGVFVLTSPQFPRYPVTIRVQEGGAAFDPFVPPTREPAKAPGVSAFAQQDQGSQHLHGYVLSLQDSTTEHSTSVFFSGIERTYELRLLYPVGLNASQALLDAYTGMVKGFRLDNPPAATPTPPIKQAVGQGPFISRDEAWAQARQINEPDLQLLDARLVSEAEARRTANLCQSMIPGHPEGIWLLTASYTFEGEHMLYHSFVDAATGQRYCGEGFDPNATPYPAGQPGTTPTRVPTVTRK